MTTFATTVVHAYGDLMKGHSVECISCATGSFYLPVVQARELLARREVGPFITYAPNALGRYVYMVFFKIVVNQVDPDPIAQSPVEVKWGSSGQWQEHRELIDALNAFVMYIPRTGEVAPLCSQHKN